MIRIAFSISVVLVFAIFVQLFSIMDTFKSANAQLKDAVYLSEQSLNVLDTLAPSSGNY